MKFTQLRLFLLLYITSFCVQDTSKGAAMATNSTDGPQGQREVRTTAYARSRHVTAKNANGSHLKAGDLNSAAADWSRFPVGTKFNICHHAERCIIGVFARSQLISLNQAHMKGVLHS